MAKHEQLDILKQGVTVWNKWRNDNPSAQIDLRNTDLTKLDVGTVHNRIDLRKVDFHNAGLGNVIADELDLSEANLSGISFLDASLWRVNLYRANVVGGNLGGSNLAAADFTEANLSNADLTYANLTQAEFKDTNLIKANLGSTILSGVDLRFIKGLDDIVHEFPSFLSTDTMKLSNGEISNLFLRGCGLSDWEINSAKLYNSELSNEEINQILYTMYDLRAQQPLQISPVFISYNHIDSSFVDKLEELLNEKGIRFWRDIHNATSGRLEKQIDRAIRQNPTVVLVLSEHSIKSDWVQHETRKARELEKELGRDVLCPVALDDSWKSSLWPERIMEQVKEYNILDFSAWKDNKTLNIMFKKLINGLNLYYKK